MASIGSRRCGLMTVGSVDLVEPPMMHKIHPGAPIRQDLFTDQCLTARSGTTVHARITATPPGKRRSVALTGPEASAGDDDETAVAPGEPGQPGRPAPRRLGSPYGQGDRPRTGRRAHAARLRHREAAV